VVATEPAQRLHATVAASVVVLGIAYAVALSAGLLTLPSPQHPIQDPWFTAMELLIIAIAPIALMSMCAVITCCVHFSILTVSRELISTRPDWAEHLFSFRWPSLAYALDILAWDFFFPIAAFCGAATIEGGAIQGWARRLIYISAALALLGIAGVPLANMQVRNIGIIVYAVAFPLGVALLAWAYVQGSRPRS
jgi:hypothetical protein